MIAHATAILVEKPVVSTKKAQHGQRQEVQMDCSMGLKKKDMESGKRKFQDNVEQTLYVHESHSKGRSGDTKLGGSD